MLADLGGSLDYDVLMQTNPGGEDNLRPYDAEWTDCHISADGTLNLRRVMDFRQEAPRLWGSSDTRGIQLS